MDKKRVTIFSWALYDFSNAIFGMNVIALYFALWVTVEKGAEDIVYGFVLGLSMLIAAIAMPILGAISDKKNERVPFLIIFTLLCVLFLSFIGMVESIFLGLLFFAIANLGYLISGAVFYNALLPYVADEESIGRVSGYGVCLSYVGVITGLLAIRPIALKFGYQATFIPTAFFFLIFALPCFIFVKDKDVRKIKNIGELIKGAFLSLKNTLKEIRASKNQFDFFLSLFIIINIVNTVFIFMSVYLKEVVLLKDAEIITLYIVSNIFSIIGALASGVISDRIGPKKTLLGAIMVCVLSVFLAIISFHKNFFWVIGPLAGLAFSGIRVSGRAFAITLFPKERIGEIFGLLGFLSNLAFIGLLIWGAVVFIFGPLGPFRYRIALFVSLCILTWGVTILRKVSPE